MKPTDPYLVLLRRELIRAQARLRRCERERDALRATLGSFHVAKKPAAARLNSIVLTKPPSLFCLLNKGECPLGGRSSSHAS
jgi:hypothetical protein